MSDTPARLQTSPTPARLLSLLAAWVDDHNIPFWILSAGMIVMLLWAGAFKMTAPGAAGITPLVTHSPFISWQFALFGPRLGSTMIGATEWTAAILYLIGYVAPRAGIVAGCITVGMFCITSSMLITTPGDTIVVHGIHYMNDTGLFLYKDIMNLGASAYLITAFGRRAAARDVQAHGSQTA